MHVLRSLMLVAAVAALPVLQGCSVINGYEDPVAVGSWELDTDPNSEMDIELDGDGDATLADPTGDITYDIDWTQEGEDDFELELECKNSPSGCNGEKFTMICDASSSGDSLRCEAPGHEPADFQWNRKD